MQPLDENLIKDGLQFKRDIGSPSSSLYCYRQGLYVLREFYITKAKNAHSRKDEERAGYYMGIVEGIDQSIHYPDKMVKKWESMVQEQVFAGGTVNGAGE